MEATVKVTEIKEQGDWFNLITDKGKVSVKKSEANPKTVATIVEAIEHREMPFNLTGELVNGKTGYFMWDIQPKADKPQKKFGGRSPEETKSIVIQACIKSAVHLHANIYEGDIKAVLKDAEELIKFHNEQTQK